MELTDREIIAGVFSSLGFILAMLFWHFLDNRKQHDEINGKLGEHNDTVMQHLIKIYEKLGDRD